MIRTAIKQLAIRWLASGAAVRIRYGALRGCWLPGATARDCIPMVLGRYESYVASVLCEELRRVPCCHTVYDIGAHLGFYTLLMAQHPTAPHVVAFEPSRREALLLRELIRLNALNDRVTVQEIAVCDESCDQTFFSGTNSFTGILAKHCDASSLNSRPTVVVAGMALDDFVYGNQLPPPDFLKIDVESAEAAVLAGASRVLRDKRPHMLIEVHGPRACHDTLKALLAHNYSVEHLDARSRTAVTLPDQLENKFWRGHWTNHIVAVPA